MTYCEFDTDSEDVALAPLIEKNRDCRCPVCLLPATIHGTFTPLDQERMYWAWRCQTCHTEGLTPQTPYRSTRHD